MCRGFRQGYHIWIWHGEEGIYRKNSNINYHLSEQPVEDENPLQTEHHLQVHTQEVEPNLEIDEDNLNEGNRVDIDEENINDDDDGDQLNEMLDVVEDQFRTRSGFESLTEACELPLYHGCDKYTKLSAVLTLFNIISNHGWSDTSFMELLEALQDMFPEGNQLPKSNYYAKKLLCPLDLGYIKIDACPSDCILYRNEYADLHRCPRCGKSRYKLGDQIIFDGTKKYPSTKKHAKLLRCYKDRRIKDGKLRHPADSPQWEIIDDKYPEFKNEVRSLIFCLSTDRMIPYGSLSSLHSTWLVSLVIYNLPPWLCMKRKYMMLPLLISGPKQIGNDVDMYLAPLIDDLKKLWDEGVTLFNAHADENFTLREMLFCTINDFPSYGNLSGYKVKGKKPCPMCEDDMKSTYLTHSRKYVYMDNRRFLKRFHPYRKKKLPFNGKVEEEVARKALSEKEVVDPETLDALQVDVTETLCQFEMYFPPSFFDIMVHLILHLVQEIKLCGPVFLRWAYPFERHMVTLPDKVKNPARPEASIIQGIISEMVTEFCSEFVSKLQAIGLPRSKDDGRFEGKGLVGAKVMSAPSNLRSKAHIYVLQQSDEVQPYLTRHKQVLASEHPSRGERWLMQEQNHTFINWFYDEVMQELSNDSNDVSNTIKWLAYGPRESVTSYEGFTING
ncbi:uncharacterized protein LOC141608390 [Silene latifolia]|uniref:uncharacterized protein LOC141608390 n=1 Tax=Silene latifolia TaxID=37657 RepID=UPI003D78B312